MSKEESNDKNHESLVFIVNGTETYVEKVNIHQPLHVAVKKALDQTGNTGRPLEDWQVIYNDQTLDINRKVEEFHFASNAVIFLSLKAGQGGGI